MCSKLLHKCAFHYPLTAININVAQSQRQQIKHIELLDPHYYSLGISTRNKGYTSYTQEIKDYSGNIPRRVLKRIEAHGLTIADIDKRRSPNKNESINEIKQLVDDMVIGELQDNQHEFPSDKHDSSIGLSRMDQTRNAFRPKVDPKKTSLILFPGQGSQFVGMGSKLLQYKGVKDMYNMASEILGYDLLDVCLNGPKTQLDKTIVCQPAVLVASVAAIEKLQEEYPEVANNCTGSAGFSLGEYSALVYSGMLSFTDAVKVVKVRAEAMQKASEMIPSGMMTVFIGHDTKLNFALLAAREYCSRKLNIEMPVCCVANYIYSDCKVIAGNEEALQFIEDNYREFKIRRIKRLPVSGAFHTNLMDSARKPVVKMLSKLEIKKPLFRVHSNVTTKHYQSSKDVISLLSKQIVKPVKWEQILHMLYSRRQGENFPQTYEVGPGRQLGTLLKMVNSKAYSNYYNIDV